MAIRIFKTSTLFLAAQMLTTPVLAETAKAQTAAGAPQQWSEGLDRYAAKPSPQEVRLYDAARLAGIGLENTQDVLAFLEKHGVTNIPDKAYLEIRISAKNPGRIYIDSSISGVGTKIKRALNAEGIEATLDTSDAAPESGSSVYFDGKLLEDYAAKLGDFSTDARAFNRVFSEPLSQIIADYPAHRFNDIRALNLLQEAGGLTPPFRNDALSRTKDLLVEASKLMSVSFSAMRTEKTDPRRLVDKLAKKLSALDDLGTALRIVNAEGTEYTKFKVNLDGGRIETEHGGDGFAAIEIGHDKKYFDYTLTMEEAASLFKDDRWKAEYNRYYDLFKVAGMKEEIIGQFNGSLGDFFKELTNPKSAMAVALKQATIDRGHPENPVEQAGISEGQISNVYDLAMTSRKHKGDLLRKWNDGTRPWFGLSGATYLAIINEADTAPKNVKEEQLIPLAQGLLRKYVGEDALDRVPANATTRGWAIVRESLQLKQ